MKPRMSRRELPDPYKVEIVLDSISPCGARLTTFALTYPRFVHAELMTHRAFSRNSASSRAIPSEKMRKLVEEHPALPVWWGKNQSGMQAREELSDDLAAECLALGKEADGYWARGDKDLADKIHSERMLKARVGLSTREKAQQMWIAARDAATTFSASLARIGLHKQLCNRLTEPWMPITVLVSATSFANWFHLRDHKDAQPEIQIIATEMHYQYNESTPQELATGEWHIPYISDEDWEEAHQIDSDMQCEPGCPGHDPAMLLRKASVGRCARVSYLTHEGKRELAKDIELHDKLASTTATEDPGHFSPFEHVAQALNRYARYGNFIGWVQYRKEFANEAGPPDEVLMPIVGRQDGTITLMCPCVPGGARFTCSIQSDVNYYHFLDGVHMSPQCPSCKRIQKTTW